MNTSTLFAEYLKLAAQRQRDWTSAKRITAILISENLSPDEFKFIAESRKKYDQTIRNQTSRMLKLHKQLIASGISQDVIDQAYRAAVEVQE